MARKWKQINKFVEILDAALAASPLARQQHIEVLDFGAGKGYLTFAVHDWLQQGRHIAPDVIGTGDPPLPGGVTPSDALSTGAVFARRYRLPSGERFEGFVPTSADKLFQSTDVGR